MLKTIKNNYDAQLISNSATLTRQTIDAISEDCMVKSNIVVRCSSFKFNHIYYKIRNEDFISFTEYADGLVNLPHAEKTKNKEAWEFSDYGILLTVPSNLIGVNFKGCDVMIFHKISVSLSDLYQDFGRLARDLDIGIGIIYITRSSINNHINISTRKIKSIADTAEYWSDDDIDDDS
uniref:Phage protein n=1 Tax=Strongyloides papillosus TaxID=174720 RepID=A0A0N5CIC2_STREA